VVIWNSYIKHVFNQGSKIHVNSTVYSTFKCKRSVGIDIQLTPQYSALCGLLSGSWIHCSIVCPLFHSLCTLFLLR
jgi:hypothetical protein